MKSAGDTESAEEAKPPPEEAKPHCLQSRVEICLV